MMVGNLQAKPCNECQAPIIWPRSARSGTATPLDAQPSPRGNVALYERGSGTQIAAVLTPRAAAGYRAAGQPTYLHHAVSCPFAARWNKGAARAEGRS
ncbi:hypothetical protein ACL02T_33075 [Pseudonocardia sp. RS010]|uniref:hypothetical protein n=1 Tax=Pseudonocardia sp. RS010 TaxID=3385979 RepID=UPI0039A2A79A